MENLRKKNHSKIMEIKGPFSENENTVESHSSRREQVEDRLSELKDKIGIKEKIEELLVKQLKTGERNMQELTNSIKRPNLIIMGIEEGEEVQSKEIHNIFNKIITKNFPNVEKECPIEVQESSKTPNRLDKTDCLHGILLLKQLAQRTEKEYRRM
jgi:chromosome segregation ATPase